MKNSLKRLLISLPLLSCSAYAELKFCKDEVIHHDNLSITLPKIDIPAIAYSDGMHISFSRRRCADLPYYTYELIAEVTPTELGKSIFEAYDFYGVQGKSQQFMNIAAPYNLGKTEKFRLGTSSTRPGYEPLSHLFIDLSKSFTLEMRCATAFKAHCTDKTLTFNHFSGTTPPAAAIISNVSGLWYDPTYNGSGFNIVQTAQGILFYFYGYKSNADGQTQWLASAVGPTTVNKGKSYSIKVYTGFTGNGANFSQKPSSPPGLEQWGTADIRFDSCTGGTITLNGKDGNITHNIVRLANSVETSCTEK